MSDHFTPSAKNKLEIHLWWITACLIAINVGLFAWQVMQGMDISQPSTLDAIGWGADYAPLSYLSEPFRLFSSMFFHFGLVHLMLNMWALYLFGHIAEQLFGRLYFIGLYLLAGLMGSLLSGYISIQDTYELIQLGQPEASLYPSVGAGASGAVMGLGAALTVLSLFPALPQQRFILDKKTLLMVMGINLVMGFTISGINNAAHIGGMLMGAILVVIWYASQKTSKASIGLIMGLMIGTALCYGFYLYNLHLVAEIEPLWKELAQWVGENQR
ncbi:rhomboid family intramembrane serine protease [Acinetobacter lanii]|uniref:Rhomboid family intramembrane serine protease n=1 Tax=Acinetobacter lanii TaxID=2715163 RepID=A0A6G8S643_9GAMM|nr:rhomboid family intramembrane serine protease [Acinetobacter lanii]QIO09580.1 rhomboid family intramembrane serine protease [Acinetobacter lanii]